MNPTGRNPAARILQDFADEERAAAARTVDEHAAPPHSHSSEIAVDAAGDGARAHEEEPRHQRVDDEHAAGEPLEAEHEQHEQD